MFLVHMLHPIILLFAFVEYRDDTMKNASIWNLFFIQLASSAFSSNLQIYLLGKKGTKSDADA